MKNQRKYDREFKINAAKLYQESGKSMVCIAQDLGIPLTTLAKWVKQFKEHGESGFLGSGALLPCNRLLSKLPGAAKWVFLRIFFFYGFCLL